MMSSRFRSVFIAGSILFFLTGHSAGQITWGGCQDALGTPVASRVAANLNDVARAAVDNGYPVIYYNPSVISWLTSQTRLFVYGHECGHHAMGQVIGGLQMLDEQQADCYGIVTLVGLGLLSNYDVSIVQQQIANFGPGDWSHLPGPQRAINLRHCLQSYRPVRTHVACIHPMHPLGDAVPCQHIVPTMYGPRPLHQYDVIPCQHQMHPAGHDVLVIANANGDSE